MGEVTLSGGRRGVTLSGRWGDVRGMGGGDTVTVSRKGNAIDFVINYIYSHPVPFSPFHLCPVMSLSNSTFDLPHPFPPHLCPLPPSVSTPVYSPGSVPVSRRRSGTPGGASIDDNFLASMIFDTPTKPTSSAGLQKSPHHKSTSALSDVQTSTPPPSKPHLSSSARGKSHTLAVTESPSYLSSIGGGYADDLELSPSSSIASGGNASFTAGGQQVRGTPGGMDLAEEIMMHFGGPDGARSPTGSHSSAHKPDHSRNFELPTASSPVTRYKRATSPTIGFPTESRHQFVLSHDTHPPSHMAGGRPQQRSHSPDFPVGRDPYSSSYHPPSMMNQAAVASGYHQKSRTPTKPGGGQPNQYQKQRSMGGGVSPHNHHPHYQDDMDPQMRYQLQGSKTMPNPSRNPLSPGPGHGHGNPPMSSGGGGGGGGLPEGVGGQQQQQQQGPPRRGGRKVSEQEMGLLEVLNMWDKSNQNPFGDGTLV